MDAKLIRTLSMVTVKVDGTNLSVSTGKEQGLFPKESDCVMFLQAASWAMTFQM